jgi:hypothetical protein
LLEVRDLSTGEFQVENGFIHADATVLYIRYIARVEDPNVYDPCSSIRSPRAWPLSWPSP